MARIETDLSPIIFAARRLYLAVPLVTLFVDELMAQLEKCFQHLTSRSQAQREKMWAAYHQMRTASTFKSAWVRFLAASTTEAASPILYHHITEINFKQLVVKHFPIGNTSACADADGTTQDQTLSYAML